MSDLKKLPYAEWLEQSLQHIVDKPVQSICLITKFESGEIGTGYYGADMTDKLIFAGFIQQDAMFDSMAANGLLEDDEEDEDDE